MTGGAGDSVDEGFDVSEDMDQPLSGPTSSRPEGFADERAYARWVLANGKLATNEDRAYVESLIEQDWFRQGMDCEKE